MGPLPSLDGRKTRLETILSVALAGSAAAHVDPPSGELKRHHIGVQVGAFDPATESIAIRPTGEVVPLDHAALLGTLSYRYALNPFVDIDVKVRHWIGHWTLAPSETVEIAAGFIGPGMRVYAFDRLEPRRVRPYVEANLYYVQEQHTLETTSPRHGIGFGLSGGVDFAVTRWLSLPVEISYLRSVGGELNDLSGAGVSLGVEFRF